MHAGAGAGHVLSTGSAQGGNGQFFVQDFQGFAPNQGYALDVWVYPVAAQTQAVLLFGWDRNAGSVSGSAGVTINPGSVTYGAWGRSAVVPGISYGAWHELTVVAHADLTSAFYEDGVQVAGIGIPGQQLPFETTSSLVLGDDCGNCTTGGNEAGTPHNRNDAGDFRPGGLVAKWNTARKCAEDRVRSTRNGSCDITESELDLRGSCELCEQCDARG